LEAALERAEEAVKVAEAEYDRVNRGPKPDDIKAQKVHVEMKKNAVEGAKAKKARLENPDPPPPALASEIKQAKLALEQAQTNERFAKEALDDAQRPPDPNKIRAAEAAREKREVELSSLNLHKEGFTLRAPFDGQITKKHYDAYATVPAYVPIVSMADFSHKRVRAEYDVAHLADIKPGMSVIIRSRSFNKEELEGKVLKEKWRIGARKIATEDPAAPKGGEIVEVLIEVEEPKSEAKKKLYDEVLQIGLPVDTEVVFEERLNVLRVPKSYVAQENGNPYVLLLERDRASGKTEAPRKRHVKCGLRDAQFVEIIEGLNDGDTIMKPKAKNER
jgi:multidrug efflux pump subunit AcrA (membrane-fusion protein)